MAVNTEVLSPTGASGEGSSSAPGGEPRLLSEIPRTHSLSIELVEGGDALLIDDRIVLACERLPDAMAERLGRGLVYEKTLVISRERVIPVVYQRHGGEIMMPYANEEELRGDAGTLFVYQRKTPKICFIGEDFKVTFLPTEEPSARVIIDAAVPFKSKPITHSLNYDLLLRSLMAHPRSL